MESSVSTIAARVNEICDRTKALIDQGDAAAAQTDINLKLGSLRATSSQEEWRSACVLLRQHPVHALLVEDAFIGAAYRKLRGYPGDAAMLDYLYEYPPLDDVAGSAIGRALCRASLNRPIVAAIRTRRDFIAGAIRETMARVSNPIVVSVACGHMRELQCIDASASGLTVIGLDQDANTVETLRTLHPTVQLRATAATVRSIVERQIDLPPADLVYASGLYDYLPDRAAIALTIALTRCLRPGGLLLVPNLTPANDEIAYLEAVADWWMIYRTRDDLRVLGNAAESSDEGLETSVMDLADGRIACLAISRSAKEAGETGRGEHSPPHFSTTSAVTIPNIPCSLSACGRM